MHNETTRPGLAAATTAGRALLAAGWVYDSTSPMADDTTIRTLLHPSGREIHARTVDRDGDDTTSLTMTGLSLEQVAGAIAGAGLGEPATDAPQTREIKDPLDRRDLANDPWRCPACHHEAEHRHDTGCTARKDGVRCGCTYAIGGVR